MKKAERYEISHINDFKECDNSIDAILYDINGIGFDDEEYICCWVDGDSWEDITTYGVSTRNDLNGEEYFNFSDEEKKKISDVVKNYIIDKKVFK